ncbi:nuclear transport factor 2 family protein [Actinomadura sp. 9N407]|uniref:nuclear transport factor 2 family protein n=1 Tax=Actinomadura sp. 9N407 TaxID=3375154 RepID=UPI0037B49074
MNAIEEIIEHHRFIESWLRGTATDVSGFLEMHTPDFTWYDPDGSLAMLPDLAGAMEKAHGTVPDLELRIREPRELLNGDGMVVATYEEHQTGNTRRAVAVFVPDPKARNGLRWRHLHETWIQADS